MPSRTWLATLAMLATLGAVSASLASAATPPPAADLRALDGEWIYVEDRTEGRAVEQQGPPMSPKLKLRVEEAALVLLRSEGEIRMALDGTATDVVRESGVSRYSGTWKDGAFSYEIEMLRASDKSRTGLIRAELRPTAEGLLLSVQLDSPTTMKSLALYRHAEDIALPVPAKAVVADLAWLAGAWVGTRGKSSIEERWSPPAGGAMLGVSRTVSSRGTMSAFEYLRVIERDGGLVYVAQPGGKTATEFTLTELSATRAVFENPRHDSPQRIVYELSAEGGLSASIGFTKGGQPTRFEFKREGA